MAIMYQNGINISNLRENFSFLFLKFKQTLSTFAKY